MLRWMSGLAAVVVVCGVGKAVEVKGPVVLNLVDEGNHIANNRAYCWRTQSADWMAEQLRAG